MSNPVIASTRGSVHLTGVAETMLWTLHDRAREAMRDDTFLRDPDCVRIYRAISYDYERSFGKPDGSHPMRSRMFDEAVRRWMRAHPGGAVVELAAGLETQFQRVDDGKVNWSCVDVPEAIALRDRFLPPSDRCSYVAQSALDLGWLDEIDASRGVFVSAQGLLMYFEEAQVRRLFCAMVDRWPGVEILFDTIPRWFSKKTLKGFGKTRHYTAPPMPWGVSRDALPALLRGWSSAVTGVEMLPYGTSRGVGLMLIKLFSGLPVLRNALPQIVRVTTWDGRLS